jgi:hypothetical protein
MDALRYEVAAANRRESNAMINQEIEQLIQEDPDFGYAPRQKKYQGIVDYPNLDDMVEVKTRPATADEIKNYVEYSDRKSAGRFWNYLVNDDSGTLGGPSLIQRQKNVRVKSEISISGDENYSLFSSTDELDSFTSGVTFPRTSKMNYNVKMSLMPAVSSASISNTNNKNMPKFKYDATQWSKQKKDVSEESDIININALKQKSKTKTTTDVITWQTQKTNQKQDTRQTVKTTFKAPTINIKTTRTDIGQPKALAFDFGSAKGFSSSFFSMSSDKTKWKNPGFVSDWVTARPPFKSRKGRKDRRRSH